ncbi:MAG: outer membrane protein transport protein [Candidatus Brocadiae bacterium]|nr:outer membrane protein transport protein [Candidatus Brocadiia bacterium]
MYRICFLILLLLCFSCHLYATNGMFPIFMGAQGAGRAGVDIGIASDPTCLNTNPAGIGFIHGKTTEFSTGFFLPTITFSNSYNNADSDFEPVPMATFAMVLDSPSQTWEGISDPFVYLFGGEPIHTDYVYFSGGQPFPVNQHSGNTGQGVLETKKSQSGKNLSLVLQGRSAKVSEIRVYGHIPFQKSTQKPFFSCKKHPLVPQEAKVRAIQAHFQWRLTQECPLAQVALSVEGQQEILNLKALPGSWQEGYIALAWEKDTIPANIHLFSLTENAPVEIKNIEIKSGYRIQEKYYWQTLSPLSKDTVISKESFQLLFSDTKEYELKGDKNLLSIPLPLSPAEKIQNISIHYSYTLDAQDSSRNLEVSLVSQEKKIKSEKHLLSYREPSQKNTPICQRRADQETTSVDRSPGWKWGIGVFPQAGARYSMEVVDQELFPEGVENRTDLIFASFVPGIAYRFNERFSIGLALNINFMTMELDGLVSQESTILKGKPIEGTDVTFGDYLIGVVGENTVRGEIDTNYLIGFGIGSRIGFLWKVTDRFQIGAMYCPPGWMMDAKGTANLDFNRHFEQIGVANIAKIVLPNKGQSGFSGKYDVEVEFDMPQRLGFGFSWLFLDDFLFAMDFQWINYSETQFELKAKMKNGSNVDLNALAGSANVNPSFKIGWKDQYVVSFAFVWQATPHWTWRTGYNYGNNPIPKKYLNPQLAAITEHHVTLGTSYLVSRYLSLNAAIEVSLPSKMSSGSENLVHQAYANSKLEIFNIGAILGVSLRF